jgi:glutamine phosphoribosylpyrophosphate amidotransferase
MRGIVVNNDGCLEQTRGMGLVSEVFTSDALSKVDGRIAIGTCTLLHCGRSNINNAQPLMVNCREGQIAIAHNGNLTNTVSLRNALNDDGVVFFDAIRYRSDCESDRQKLSERDRGSYQKISGISVVRMLWFDGRR